MVYTLFSQAKSYSTVARRPKAEAKVRGLGHNWTSTNGHCTGRLRLNCFRDVEAEFKRLAWIGNNIRLLEKKNTHVDLAYQAVGVALLTKGKGQSAACTLRDWQHAANSSCLEKKN